MRITRSSSFNWRRTAVALAAGSVVMAMGGFNAAFAQSNTTGNIFGVVSQPAGAEIVVENIETGLKRTLKPDANGRFQFISLPTGTYRVLLMRGNAVVQRQDNVEVLLSQGSEVAFTGDAQRIVVTGAIRKLDVTSAGSTTIFTAKELERLPVAANVGAVIQLAPNTTRGDSRYGGGNSPSFGGSGASENAYYINGFPVTTLLTQVGFSQLPFNSIGQAQVLTGGYGAEFGRSTGGVVNIVTKRGGSEWVLGGAFSWSPSGLRQTEKSSLYENNGTTLDGKYRFYNALNKREEVTYSAYLGGPLIKDKLFMFFGGELNEIERQRIRTANNSVAGLISSTGFQEQSTSKPRALLKLDWAIVDGHDLEYTHIRDNVTDNRRYYGFNYQTLQRNNVQNGGVTYTNWGPAPTVAAEQGAIVDILKYTGNLTKDLTVTVVGGRTRTEHQQLDVGFNPALPQLIADAANQAPGILYPTTLQGVAGRLLTPGAFDENKGIRLDVEYKLSSRHTLRAGIDQNTIKSLAGTSTAGTYIYRYGKTNPAVKLNPQTAATNTVVGNPLAQQGYFVEEIVGAGTSTPSVDQTAQYIEDRFQVTDKLLLTLGLRNEGFNNKNGDGQSYIKLNKQLAPRLSAAFDAMGDGSMKVFGSVGRYHVPVPTNVAVRAAGASLNAQTNYVYTGVDPLTGKPTGTTAISPFYSNNNELGQSKDPAEVAAQNLKGNYQDELALGIEMALNKSWNVGAKFTDRSLKTAIDDHCDDRPFRAWALRNGIDDSSFGYNCALFNPGIGNTFTLDLDGDGKREVIKLSAAELGFPKVKRKYTALDLFFEHPFDGKWWTKVTYTLSRNTGNTEGQLLSDIGQGDVATTQAFDFPEFSVNSDGLLPNDRKHQLKVFGYLQATPEWGVGGNLLIASGRPKNCIGNAPDPVPDGVDPHVPYTPPTVTNFSGYGSAYFFCNGVASPRGSAGRLPTDTRFDMNVVYTPEAAKGLKFRLDIFNLFNKQSIETIEERFNTPGGASSVWTRYRHVESYSAPRSMKFTASYDHKF